jgi:iron(III) transport system ATP-binding protein
MSVKLVNISKVFDSPEHAGGKLVAVKDVNLEVYDGEMVTLLGPSGCGKTTTLRIISGFETPTTGEVWIEGEQVNDQPPNRRDTSMVFQSYAIFPHLSVSRNIGFGLELKGWKPARIREEVRRIMEIMNLRDMYNRRPDQLSGGQQQRVALARAIINKPSVLLFDEPLSNLDAKLREQMRIEIRRIQQSFRITSIYVTHDQSEAMTVSDRIVIMSDGEVMQVGTPIEIYSRPANLFVADFIGKVNLFEGRVVERQDGGYRVAYAGGQKDVASAAAGLSAGQAVRTVVRPEALRLARAGKASAGAVVDAPGPARGFFHGSIVKVVYLGPTVEYEIRVQGQERLVSAVVSNPIEAGFFDKGEEVTLDFHPQAAHLLPEESARGR